MKGLFLLFCPDTMGHAKMGKRLPRPSPCFSDHQWFQHQRGVVTYRVSLWGKWLHRFTNLFQMHIMWWNHVWNMNGWLNDLLYISFSAYVICISVLYECLQCSRFKLHIVYFVHTIFRLLQITFHVLYINYNIIRRIHNLMILTD